MYCIPTPVNPILLISPFSSSTSSALPAFHLSICLSVSFSLSFICHWSAFTRGERLSRRQSRVTLNRFTHDPATRILQEQRTPALGISSFGSERFSTRFSRTNRTRTRGRGSTTSAFDFSGTLKANLHGPLWSNNEVDSTKLKANRAV